MNRREALQAGLGIVSAVAIDGEVATLSAPHPKAFVLTTPRQISAHERERLWKDWQSLFTGTEYAGVPLVILPAGMQLSVMTEDAQ